MANDISIWFQNKLANLNEEIQQVAQDTAEAGENITKHNVEISGTAKSGKRGRVETGKMRDSVTSNYTNDGNLEATVKFGWLNGTPDYAWYQELGFVHWKSGELIDGMYALTDARDEVVQDLREDLKRRISGI